MSKITLEQKLIIQTLMIYEITSLEQRAKMTKKRDAKHTHAWDDECLSWLKNGTWQILNNV